MRKQATVEDRRIAEAALRESAEQNGGSPNFTRVARETRRARETLVRWWDEMNNAEPEAKRRGSVHVLPAPEKLDPRTVSEVEYWLFAWEQIQRELDIATSDVARLGLFKRQDDVFRSLRSAMEAEMQRIPQDPEEVARMLEDQAASLPPALASRLVAVFRRRGMVA